jgi:hypothetical protein
LAISQAIRNADFELGFSLVKQEGIEFGFVGNWADWSGSNSAI